MAQLLELFNISALNAREINSIQNGMHFVHNKSYYV